MQTSQVEVVFSPVLVADALTATGATQVELAAALNVTQPALSQWARGLRQPNAAVVEQLRAAVAAADTPARTVAGPSRRGYQPPIVIPERLWTPVFRPAALFRLPHRLEWSGTPRQRWRDASDLDQLLAAYEITLSVGRAADMVLWVDPVLLSRHAARMFWPRGYERPWRDALEGWGLA